MQGRSSCRLGSKHSAAHMVTLCFERGVFALCASYSHVAAPADDAGIVCLHACRMVKQACGQLQSAAAATFSAGAFWSLVPIKKRLICAKVPGRLVQFSLNAIFSSTRSGR